MTTDNIQRSAKESVWLVLVVIVGCIFIAKRMFFAYREKKESMITDVLGYTLVAALVVIFLYGNINAKQFAEIGSFIVIILVGLGLFFLLTKIFN